MSAAPDNVATLAAKIATLEAELRDLDRTRNAVRGELAKAQRDHAKAQRERKANAREPDDLRELNLLIGELRGKLSRPDPNPEALDITRADVRAGLEALEADTTSPTRERLATARKLTGDYAARHEIDQHKRDSLMWRGDKVKTRIDRTQ